MRRRIVYVVLLLGLGTSGPVWAETWDDWCDHNWNRGNWENESFCELREFELEAPRGTLHVDAAPNGAIRVEGWDGNGVRLIVRVTGWSRRSESVARDIVKQVEIATGGTIEVRGPHPGRNAHWSADFWLFVPNGIEMDLESQNGGIALENVNGALELRTVNGGISVSGVSGDIRGRTTNGGLDVELTGRRWEGEGLDLVTTNGGVDLDIPQDYNARLQTSTVNGTLRTDFPVTLRGRIDRQLHTTLGDGGPTIRARTTNGGVVLRDN